RRALVAPAVDPRVVDLPGLTLLHEFSLATHGEPYPIVAEDGDVHPMGAHQREREVVDVRIEAVSGEVSRELESNQITCPNGRAERGQDFSDRGMIFGIGRLNVAVQVLQLEVALQKYSAARPVRMPELGDR